METQKSRAWAQYFMGFRKRQLTPIRQNSKDEKQIS